MLLRALVALLLVLPTVAEAHSASGVSRCIRAVFSNTGPTGHSGLYSQDPTAVGYVLPGWSAVNYTETLDTHGYFAQVSVVGDPKTIWAYTGPAITARIVGNLSFWIHDQTNTTHTYGLHTAYKSQGTVSATDNRTRGVQWTSPMVTHDTGTPITSLWYGNAAPTVSDSLSLTSGDSLGLLFYLGNIGYTDASFGAWQVEVEQLDPPCY